MALIRRFSLTGGPLYNWWVMVVGAAVLVAALVGMTPASAATKPDRLILVDDSAYAPYAFLDPEGRPAGITIDLWRLWSEKTGIDVEFRLMTWKDALAAVAAGEADAVAGLVKTEDRQKIFTFSRSFLTISAGIFFHEQLSGIRSIDDLDGFSIGVVADDSSEELIRKKYPKAVLLRHAGNEELVRAAVEGKVKLFVADQEVVRYYLAKFDHDGIIREATSAVLTSPLYTAIKKGKEDYLPFIEQGFAEISSDEVEAVVGSWTGRNPLPQLVWSAILLPAAALIALVALIVIWNINLRKTVAKALAESRQHNVELEKSEARFKAFFDLAPFDCVVHDLQGRFRMVNQAFCQRIGRREEELLGHTSAEMGLLVDEGSAGQALIEILQTGAIYKREAIVDSTLGPLHALYSSRLLEFGGEQLILSATVDITERKRAEEALRESENSFTRLFESAPIPMAFAADIDGYQATTWNECWYRTFGYTRVEADGRSGADFGLWADPEDRRRFVASVSSRTSFNALEVLMRRSDGDIRTCEVYGRFIGKTGRQILMAVYLDITERKQAENGLRESEERFSKAFRLSPAPMVISDIRTGRFIDVNEQWLAMLGHRREDMIGRTSYEIGIWHDPGVRTRLGEKVAEDRSFRDQAVQFVTKNGEIRDVFWSAEVINLGGTEVMLSLLYDNTERKQAEEEREKLQTQLLQSQKMESIGRLAGGVAHDYNNMMGVILGHTELAMLKSGEEHPLAHHLREIMQAAKRSAELTQQLLAFARRQTIAPKVVDLNSAVAETLQMLRWLIGENIELKFLPGAGPYPVKVDGSQLDQLLVNLCVNARDAISGVGRISIETSLIHRDQTFTSSLQAIPPGEYVLLSISDTGSGMDKETQIKVFEPFFTTKPKGQGTGLGLATVYGTVMQHGGYIHVYSEPGQGTTFRIYFPSHAGAVLSSREPAPLSQSPGKGETILVVEDEAVLLEIVHTMLADLGYRVLPANSPAEALRLSSEYAGCIDLLLTDVVMPEMTGRELEQQILATNPALPCLFMSGYTANVISHHGVLDEGVNFIQKPFSIADVAAKIRGILDRLPSPTV